MKFQDRPFTRFFANFCNSLCYRKLQITMHLFMYFPNSQIHKELGHCPDAGDPKMAKVELQAPAFHNLEKVDSFIWLGRVSG